MLSSNISIWNTKFEHNQKGPKHFPYVVMSILKFEIK